MIAVLYVLFAAAGPWMSRQFALSRCLPEEMKIADIAHAKGGKCLVSWSRLDQSGTRSLYRARYEMSVDAKDSAAPKVVSEVLYESRSGRGLLRPLWLTQQLTDEFEIEHVTLHRVGK